MSLVSRWMAFLCLVFVFLSLTACTEMILGGIEDTVSKTFQVQPGGKLTIDSSLGSMEITTSGDSTVKIDVRRVTRAYDQKEATEILQDLNMDFQQTGNEVVVVTRYRRPRGFDWGNRLELKYLIQIPKKFHLDLKTGGGSIQVSDLEGNILARTSGGSLSFGQIQGTVNAHTSGGSINLEGGTGTVDVNTSGGSIHIGRVSADVKAQTSGGSITLEEVMGSVRASTSGGSVTAKLTKQPQNDCELSTSGGSIRVKLIPSLNMNLRASCSGGSIHSKIPMTVQGEIDKHRLNAKLNGGGPELYLHTSGGGISIDSITVD
jgi:hypothetical protein